MTTEIPREEWRRFLDEFSRRHAGWLVTIEVNDPREGRSELARDVPLSGVSAELHGRAPEIESLAGPRGREINPRIAAPSRLTLSRTPGGADEGVEMESADGTRTLVRFRTPALPETVDGLVSEI